MQAMIFQQMVNEDAGCISYLIGCSQAGEALVVDPGRDRVDDYGAWARRKGLTLTHIVETHIHADHLSGNQALAAKTGARIHIHPAAEAAEVDHAAGRQEFMRSWRVQECRQIRDTGGIHHPKNPVLETKQTARGISKRCGDEGRR